MKEKKSAESFTEQLFGRQNVDRIKAAKIYFSGELDASFDLAVTAGAVPWRILRYRRIVDPEKLGYPVSKFHYVRPATFENHLKYFSKHCRIVSLDGLISMLENGETIAPRTVVLTFDGGWIDNFVYAYPQLLKYRAHATFFLPTAFISTINYFWQDKILFALLILKEAGERFAPFQFMSEEEKDLLEQISPDGEITLGLAFALTSLLSMRTFKERMEVLTTYGKKIQQIGGDLPPEPAFFNWDDAQMMDKSGFTFGSLSHGHPMFNELTPEGMVREIRASREILSERFQNITPVFAFPEGLIPNSALPVLEDEKIDYSLGMFSAPRSVSVAKKPVILGRIPLFEGQSYCTEVLATKLWALEAFYSGS